jgi:hypothetical protein
MVPAVLECGVPDVVVLGVVPAVEPDRTGLCVPVAAVVVGGVVIGGVVVIGGGVVVVVPIVELDVAGTTAGWFAGITGAPPAERPSVSATMSTATAAVPAALLAMTR